MVKLSIIIPVYNVENYISQCLESIFSQSFKDFEIICVNDGSSDNSLGVLQNFKAKDDRIIIIDKKNEGSGIARNAGLAIAKGDYVYFVDGDDWIADNALEKMVSKADELNTDILIFGGLSCYETKSYNCPRLLREREELLNEHSEFSNSGEGCLSYKKKYGGYSADKLPKKYLNKVFSSKDIKKDIFKFPSTAWTKLYRHDFLIKNNIKFQDIKAGQDQLPFFHSMIKAERIALLPQNLYCYRKNRKGAVTAAKKKKNFSPVYVFYGIEEMLKSENLLDEYKNIFVNKYLSKATSWLGKFQDDLKSEYYSEYMKLLEHVKKEYPYGWWMEFNPKEKDGYWILKLKQYFAKEKQCFIRRFTIRRWEI